MKCFTWMQLFASKRWISHGVLNLENYTLDSLKKHWIETLKFLFKWATKSLLSNKLKLTRCHSKEILLQEFQEKSKLALAEALLA